MPACVHERACARARALLCILACAQERACACGHAFKDMSVGGCRRARLPGKHGCGGFCRCSHLLAVVGVDAPRREVEFELVRGSRRDRDVRLGGGEHLGLHGDGERGRQVGEVLDDGRRRLERLDVAVTQVDERGRDRHGGGADARAAAHALRVPLALPLGRMHAQLDAEVAPRKTAGRGAVESPRHVPVTCPSSTREGLAFKKGGRQLR
eukprot:3723059-Pleurochrysis_carterae.AAC.4